jgi:hypothetical protein
MADILARTKLLIGTTTDWAAHDLVIGDGELVLERAGSLVKMKVGNGAALYSALPFVAAEPIIPPEYLTAAEAAAAFLQLADVSVASAPNKVPRMGADGKLAADIIPLPPSVSSSVGPADAGKLVALSSNGKVHASMLPVAVNVSTGAADANKLVALNSTGKVDPTMISITTGRYRGTADATAALPAGSYLAGDYFINTGNGLAHASWGLPGGATVAPGNQLAYNGATWDLISAGAAYLPLSGGTLTGNLNIEGKLSVGGLMPPALTNARSYFQAEAAAGTAFSIIAATYGNNVIQGRSIGGTPAAPAATPAFAGLVSLVGASTFDGVAFNPTASVQMLLEATATAASQPTLVSIQTTPAGSISRREVARFDSVGNLHLGGLSAVPGARAWVAADVASGTNVALQTATYGGNNTVAGRSYGGTLAAPAATANFAGLLTLVGQGTADGANFFGVGSVQIQLESAAAAGSIPSIISLQTTPAGSTSRREVARLDSIGRLLVGSGTWSLPVAGIENLGPTRTRGAIFPTPIVTAVDLGTIAGFPVMSLLNAAGAADSKAWSQYADNSAMHFVLHNDGFSTGQDWLTVDRAGMAVNSVYFPMGSVGVGGAPALGLPTLGSTLQVKSATDNPALIAVHSQDGSKWVSLVSASNGSGFPSILYPGSSALVFASSSNIGLEGYTEHMRLDNVGNLGLNGPAAPGFRIDMVGGGKIGGVQDIAGYSNTGAYSIFGGRSALNGGYVQLYGSAHASSPDRLIFGNGGGPTLDLLQAGHVSIARGSGFLRVAGHITRFESAEQATPTSLSQTAATHGGTRAPDVFQAVLRCKVAELGYAVGDEVILKNDVSDTTREVGLLANTSSVSFLFIPTPSTGVAPAVRDKTNGTYSAVTPANWRVVLKAHWL